MSVAYDDIADHLYYELSVDTRSWSPRRFGLVRQVDMIAHDIYSALHEYLLDGRVAAKLLEFLNDAVYYIYKPASAKHQMISLYNSDLYYYRNSRRKLSSSCKKSHSDAQKSLSYLEDFLGSFSKLRDHECFSKVPSFRLAYWETVISSVISHFPADERRKWRQRRRLVKDSTAADNRGVSLSGIGINNASFPAKANHRILSPLKVPAQQETEDVIGSTYVNATNYRQAAIDPAIWVNPEDPSKSIIIAALNQGGIGIYNITGYLLNSTSEIVATGVDIIYAFKLIDSSLVDVAVVASEEELKIYRIDSDDGNYLVDITNGTIGINGSAYGVVGYISPFTSIPYAFVSRSYDSEILQIELIAAPNNTIGALDLNDTVRVLNMTIGSPGGMVVDQELGFLYVTEASSKSILKFDAEPSDCDQYNSLPTPFVTNTSEYFEGGLLTGLALYYGEHAKGYLLVSISGDSTFAVFDREDGAYLGDFAIAAVGIDGTRNTKGISIVNINLNQEFSCGLFVAQDQDNLPANTGINATNTNFKLGKSFVHM